MRINDQETGTHAGAGRQPAGRESRGAQADVCGRFPGAGRAGDCQARRSGGQSPRPRVPAAAVEMGLRRVHRQAGAAHLGQRGRQAGPGLRGRLDRVALGRDAQHARQRHVHVAGFARDVRLHRAGRRDVQGEQAAAAPHRADRATLQLHPESGSGQTEHPELAGASADGPGDPLPGRAPGLVHHEIARRCRQGRCSRKWQDLEAGHA